MDLLAKLPTLASVIYRNSYYDGKVGAIDAKRDWSANFTNMLGYADPQFTGKGSTALARQAASAFSPSLPQS